MNKPHDDLLFAKYQGFYERMTGGGTSGRTHQTNEEWSKAYDEGMNEAEALMEKPKPAEGWHVTYEIDLSRDDGDTPEYAARIAARIALEQFNKLLGHRRVFDDEVTKPALTINGQLIDFEVQS